VTVFTFKLCVPRARRQHAPACAAHVMAAACGAGSFVQTHTSHARARVRIAALACACTDRRPVLCCAAARALCARIHHRHRRLRRRRSLRSYLMAVRIQEAYTFDAHGRIVRLERCMANAAQAKLVTA
jgi:hypothetical protein